MKRFQNILVAADTRMDSHPLVEEAAAIAFQNNAKLKIVDVIPESGWLARKTNDELDHMRELLLKEKKEKLNSLATLFRDRGLDVSTRPLVGNASIEIIRESIRGEHDLVIAVAKGENSKRTGFFGQTAYRLIRKCPCAVWLVTRGSHPKFEHVLGCVDTSSSQPLDTELNDKVFELTQSVGKYHNSKSSILHTWDFADETLLSARLKPDHIAQFIRDEQKHEEVLFDTFLKQHESSIDADNIHMIKGETSDVIVNFIKEQNVDLLVLGTIARSGLTGFLIGNTAEKILERVRCSVLALKPYSFKSPVKLD